jgi:hypothetical protein
MVTAQLPVNTLQQRPSDVQGPGRHAPPCDQVFPMRQRSCVRRRHNPCGVQQAPVGGQVLGLHAPPALQVCAFGPQADWAVTVQLPVMKLQQRPVEPHALVAQVPALQEKVRAAQRSWVRRRQTPAFVQHEPGTAQVLGVQVPPWVQVWAVRPQLAEVWIEQVPTTTLQHAPACAKASDPQRSTMTIASMQRTRFAGFLLQAMRESLWEVEIRCGRAALRLLPSAPGMQRRGSESTLRAR